LDLLLNQIIVAKIAHDSYILAGMNTCAVIDPQRDVDVYIKDARAMGVDITHILQPPPFMLISFKGIWIWLKKLA
jgi:hydroxyacylglutathione hydrolase